MIQTQERRTAACTTPIAVLLGRVGSKIEILPGCSNS